MFEPADDNRGGVPGDYTLYISGCSATPGITFQFDPAQLQLVVAGALMGNGQVYTPTCSAGVAQTVTVTVTAIKDTLAEGTRMLAITHLVAGQSPTVMGVTVYDEDVPGACCVPYHPQFPASNTTRSLQMLPLTSRWAARTCTKHTRL